MNVNINEEFMSEDELKKYLIDNNFVIPATRFYCIDISKYLRDDNTINLELIEFSVRLVCQTDARSLALIGYTDYATKRGIIDSKEKTKEEFDFINGFIGSLVEEYKEGEMDLICLNPY